MQDIHIYQPFQTKAVPVMQCIALACEHLSLRLGQSFLEITLGTGGLSANLSFVRCVASSVSLSGMVDDIS